MQRANKRNDVIAVGPVFNSEGKVTSRRVVLVKQRNEEGDTKEYVIISRHVESSENIHVILITIWSCSSEVGKTASLRLQMNQHLISALGVCIYQICAFVGMDTKRLEQ